MASTPTRVRLRCAIQSGGAAPWADMMYRRRWEDPAIAEPTQAVDTEVPCFALPEERDPSIFHPQDLRTAQISDPSCGRLHAQYGAHPNIDVDSNGLIGLFLPSG
jgi:hypothetical protein